MMHVVRILGLVLAAAALPAGCQKKAPPVEVTAVPEMVSTGEPMTAADADAYGRQLQAAVAQDDAAAVGRLLRIDELAQRCIADIVTDGKRRDDFMVGFRKNGPQNFTDAILNNTRKGGSYTYLHPIREGDRWLSVFRLIDPEGAANYHKVPVARFGDGELGAADVYIMLSGEYFSLSLRRLVIGAFASLDGGLLGRLTGREQKYMQNMQKMKQIVELVQAGRGPDALALYHTLPDDLQREKFPLLAALTAVKAEDGEYLRLLTLYRETFPDDAAIDLISIDFYFLNKNYAEADRAVDNLAKAVGGDAYLETLRAGMLVEAMKLPAAEKALLAAVAIEPTLAQSYSALVAVTAKLGHYADAVKWYKKGVELGGAVTDLESLEKDPDFEDFVESDEFGELQAWVKARGEKQK